MLWAAFIASWASVAVVLLLWRADQKRHEQLVRDMLSEISTSPRLEYRPTRRMPTVSHEPTYMSDLPHHDELWDDFVAANEEMPETTLDD